MKTIAFVMVATLSATVVRAQESTAVFIRPEAMLVGTFNIIANSEFIGKVKVGNHLTVKMKEGSQLMQVRRVGRKHAERLETVVVTLQPGQTHYFLLVDPFYSGAPVELVELTEASALRLLAKQEVARRSQQLRLQAAP